MRIVITGGAGFLGSHLCDSLVRRGDSVVCVDDLSSGSLANLAELLGNGRRPANGVTRSAALAGRSPR